MKEGSEDLVEMLAEFQANHVHDALGETALHRAAEMGSVTESVQVRCGCRAYSQA